MGLTLGTFRRREFLTYLLEPAFVERGSWVGAQLLLLGLLGLAGRCST